MASSASSGLRAAARRAARLRRVAVAVLPSRSVSAFQRMVKRAETDNSATAVKPPSRPLSGPGILLIVRPRPLLLWRAGRPCSKLGNALETDENDLARQLHEQRPELVEKSAQSRRRATGPVEGARHYVTVTPVHPRDGELAEVRAEEQRAARGTTQDRGRGRTAEEVDERLPELPEKGGAGELASGIAARFSISRHALDSPPWSTRALDADKQFYATRRVPALSFTTVL